MHSDLARCSVCRGPVLPRRPRDGTLIGPEGVWWLACWQLVEVWGGGNTWGRRCRAFSSLFARHCFEPIPPLAMASDQSFGPSKRLTTLRRIL